MSNKEFPISKEGLPHPHLAFSDSHLVIGHSVLVIGNSLLLRRIRLRPENDQCPTRNFQGRPSSSPLGLAPSPKKTAASFFKPANFLNKMMTPRSVPKLQCVEALSKTAPTTSQPPRATPHQSCRPQAEFDETRSSASRVRGAELDETALSSALNPP